MFVLLRAHTGNDFSRYKRSTVYRRIERRMGLHQIDSIANYVRFLRENTHEIDLLFKELLIGVTSFFRDPAAWDHLRQDVLPGADLVAVRPGGVLRAWVPGCSTGEEAYSLAMVFREAIEPFKPVKNLVLQIFATDLDQEAIDKARQGLYPDNIAADVSPERLRRFFVQEDRGYRVAKEIREMVVFATQNVIMDPPFTRLDILACRNLLIYLVARPSEEADPAVSLQPERRAASFCSAARRRSERTPSCSLRSTPRPASIGGAISRSRPSRSSSPRRPSERRIRARRRGTAARRGRKPLPRICRASPIA